MTPLRLAILSILVGLFPIFLAISASLMAWVCGCEITEAGVTGECILFGKDISKTLYGMTVYAWFGMISIPLGMLGLIVSGIWALFNK